MEEKVFCKACNGIGQVHDSKKSKKLVIFKDCNICKGTGQASPKKLNNFMQMKDTNWYKTYRRLLNFVSH